jgi:U3 small nucleolar RNA-associated protein MPP10
MVVKRQTAAGAAGADEGAVGSGLLLLPPPAVLAALHALRPERFAAPGAALSGDVSGWLKALFDCARRADEAGARAGSGIPELVTDGFDTEQLWAMVELENASVVPALEARAAKLLKAKDRVTLLSEEEEEAAAADGADDGEEDEDDGEEDEDMEEDEDDEQGEDDEMEEESDADDVDEDGLPLSLKRSRAARGGREESAAEDDEDRDSSDGDNQVGLGPSEVDDVFLKVSEMDKFISSVEADDIAIKARSEKARAEAKKREEQSKKGAKRGRPSDDYSGDEVEEGEEDDDDKEEDEYDESDTEEQGAIYSFADLWGDEDGKSGKAGKGTKGRSAKVGDAEDEDDEDDSRGSAGSVAEEDEPAQPLTSHQKRQLEIAAQIAELEQEALAKKPWEMTGETHARARPVNSLLEKGDLDVDYLAKPAPTVTEESTRTLEDAIKQRILDGDFDDVERRLPPAQDADYRPKAELSLEKSKVGLAEEYATDYEVKVLGNQSDADAQRTAEQAAAHTLFLELCHKLDALSNLHFTPKLPKQHEDGGVRVDKEVAAIRMEEALPLSESQAGLAAPEEVMAAGRGKQGLGKADVEKGQAERRAERSANKTAKRKAKRMRELEKKVVSKLNPGLGNKHAKRARLGEVGDAKPDKSKKARRPDDSEDAGVNWNKSSDVFRKIQDAQADPDKARFATLKRSQKLGVRDASATPKGAQLRL